MSDILDSKRIKDLEHAMSVVMSLRIPVDNTSFANAKYITVAELGTAIGANTAGYIYPTTVPNLLDLNITVAEVVTADPYATKKLVDPGFPYMYIGGANPTYTNPLKIDGNLYATNVYISGGTPSKYYGTDANNKLVPMTDPDTFWQRSGSRLLPRVSTDYLSIILISGSNIPVMGNHTGAVTGVAGISNTGYGVYAQSGSGVAFRASGGTMAAELASYTAVLNDITPIVKLTKTNQGTPTVGFGQYLQFQLHNANTPRVILDSGYIINKWTDVTVGAEHSSFELHLVNAGTIAKALELTGSGELKLNNTLTVAVTGAGGSYPSLYGTSDSGIGAYGLSGTGRGILGYSTSGEGVQGSSDSGVGISASSVTGTAGQFSLRPASTDTLLEVLRITRNSINPGAIGLGGYISIAGRIVADVTSELGRFGAKWTSVIAGSETSSLEWWTKNLGVLAKQMELNSIGKLTIATIKQTSIPVYSDNAAALIGGLTAGDTYRTSTGQQMIVY